MFSQIQNSSKLSCLASQPIKKLEATNVISGRLSSVLGRLLCPYTQIARPATAYSCLEADWPIHALKQIVKGSLL